MNSSRRSSEAEANDHEGTVDHAADVEAGIRDFVRNDIAYLRRPADQTQAAPAQAAQIAPPPVVPSNPQQEQVNAVVGSVVQRVAQNTLAEIEALIGELEEMRDSLRAEGERVQREIAGYAQLSQTASESTRSISDQVAAWKRSIDGIRGN